MASNFIERFHDPKINRHIFVQRIAAFIVDFLKPFKEFGIQSEEHLQRLQNNIEMDVYKYAVDSAIWKERELPLQVRLYYQNRKIHIDLNGPLGGEVYVAMTDYLDFSTSIGPVGGYVEDEEEDEDGGPVEPGGFQYGRR